jgi:predicted TIM-barrel fold metal-dependent hydrolase
VLLYAGEPSRLLYGSDWPISSMKSYVAFVRQLELPEEDRQAILFENARRLFKIALPEAPRG